MIQNLPRPWHKQHAFILAIRVILHADGLWIAISEIDLPADLFRNARGQRHMRTRRFHAVFERAEPVHVRGMRENTPRVMLECTPIV